MQQDVFDILDVSLREDTYSRLIVEALRRSERSLSGVFGELTGQHMLRADGVSFRAGVGTDPTKHRPDIVVRAQTHVGPWWLVVEAKIQAGEGDTQTERYRRQCQDAVQHGVIAGYTLIYLTLDRESALTPGWRELSHRELAEAIRRNDRDHVLVVDPQLRLPWQAYEARLDHHKSYPPPNDTDRLIDWLVREGDDCFFVTAAERAHRLGRAIVPDPGYQVRSFFLTNLGRQQFLLQIWREHWTTGRWDPEATVPLECCVSVHYELDIPLPYNSKQATCHLHFETNPYMTGARIRKVGDEANRFLDFREGFRRAVHARLHGTNWRPSIRPLQQAKYLCPLTGATTVAELRKTLVPQLDAASGSVDESFAEAARSLGIHIEVPGTE